MICSQPAGVPPPTRLDTSALVFLPSPPMANIKDTVLATGTIPPLSLKREQQPPEVKKKLPKETRLPPTRQLSRRTKPNLFRTTTMSIMVIMASTLLNAQKKTWFPDLNALWPLLLELLPGSWTETTS